MDIISLIKQENLWSEARLKQLLSQYVERDAFPRILKWLEKDDIIVIKGPRQSGKTTLLYRIVQYLFKSNNNFNNIIYLNLDSFTARASITSPEDFVRVLELFRKEKKRPLYLFLDEVQRIENCGLFLKYIYDLKQNIKIFCSGSSSLELKSKIKEHLTGRKIEFNLFPFSFNEYIRYKDETMLCLLKEENRLVVKSAGGYFQSSFEDMVLYGGYPKVLLAKDEMERRLLLNELYESYIRKDIIDFMRIGEVEKFNRLVNFISLNIGQLINKTSLSNAIDTAWQTAEKYINILEETYVIKRLPPYYTNKLKEITHSPKVYFCDNGLRNAIIGNFQGMQSRVDTGRLIENYILSELMKCRNGIRGIHFWRTKSGAEVDLILEKNGETIPCEVKYGSFKRPILTRGFISYLETYKPRSGFILTKDYLNRIKRDSVEINFIPIWLFILRQCNT